MHTDNAPKLIAALLLASTCTSALGALSEPDQTPGSPQRVRQAISILPRVGTNQVPVMPTVPAVSVAVQPGLTQGEDWLKVLHDTLNENIQPSTLAQGAYVLNRPGTIVKGPNELLIFVPDQATRQPGEGPVLLMPCSTLEQLESQWTGQPIELSGEIFTYHNRNQLLIADYRIQKTTPFEPTPDTLTHIPKDRSPIIDDDQPASTQDDPAVRELLTELEFETQSSASPGAGVHEQMSSSSNQLTERTQVAVNTLIPGFDEGTLILRRPARMIRNAAGAWAIVFDNDDPDAQRTPELIVEPCKLLMRMERIAMDNGDASQILISGRIYTYKGSHYILPTLIQLVPPQEINTLQ